MNQFILIVVLVLYFGIMICKRFYILESFQPNDEWKKHTIPHKIWQTYKTTQLPEQALKCQATWFDQPGFKYNFMNDAQIDYFVQKHFDTKIYKAFKMLPLGVMKADFWRYCVLYKYGGVYSDIDSVLVKPMGEWGIKNEDKLIIGLENDIHFCQWTIACVAKHPILWAVIETMTEQILVGIDTSNPHFVHKYTGPGMWTRVIAKQLKMEHKRARDIYDLYKMHKTMKNKEESAFQKWGLRIEDTPFFRSQYVKNLFGSTQFSEEYQSWTKQRDLLLHKK
jgi:mannosyltransferase OCH1-like enzyme